MNTESLPITQAQIIQLSNQAYDTAKAQGFYDNKTNVSTSMMLIITEMAEAVQADRKDKHGSIVYYNKWLATSDEHAYERTLEGTVESEFADIAIRILSFLGSFNHQRPVEFLTDNQIYNRISVCEIRCRNERFDLPRGLYYIICDSIGLTDCDHSPSWVITDLLQDALCMVFALAKHLGIPLMEHIKLKMQYNETRDYKHGYKY